MNEKKQFPHQENYVASLDIACNAKTSKIKTQSIYTLSLKKYYTEDEIFEKIFQKNEKILNPLQQVIIKYLQLQNKTFEDLKNDMNKFYEISSKTFITVDTKNAKNIPLKQNTVYKTDNNEFVDNGCHSLQTIMNYYKHLYIPNYNSKCYSIRQPELFNNYLCNGYGNVANGFTFSRKLLDMTGFSCISIDVDTYTSKNKINTLIKEFATYNLYPTVYETRKGVHFDFYTKMYFNTNEEAVQTFKDFSETLCRLAFKHVKCIDTTSTQINRLHPLPYSLKKCEDGTIIVLLPLQVGEFHNHYILKQAVNQIKNTTSLPSFEEVKEDYKAYHIVHKNIIPNSNNLFGVENTTILNKIYNNTNCKETTFYSYEELTNFFNDKFEEVFLSASQIQQLQHKALSIVSPFRKDRNPSLAIMKRRNKNNIEEYVMFDNKYSCAEEAQNFIGVYANLTNISYMEALTELCQIYNCKMLFLKNNTNKFTIEKKTYKLFNIIKNIFKNKKEKENMLVMLQVLLNIKNTYHIKETNNWIPIAYEYFINHCNTYTEIESKYLNAFLRVSNFCDETFRLYRDKFAKIGIIKATAIRNLKNYNFSFIPKHTTLKCLKFMRITKNTLQQLKRKVLQIKELNKLVNPLSYGILSYYKVYNDYETIKNNTFPQNRYYCELCAITSKLIN